jgi:hypothetical protein
MFKPGDTVMIKGIPYTLHPVLSTVRDTFMTDCGHQWISFMEDNARPETSREQWCMRCHSNHNPPPDNWYYAEQHVLVSLDKDYLALLEKL